MVWLKTFISGRRPQRPVGPLAPAPARRKATQWPQVPACRQASSSNIGVPALHEAPRPRPDRPRESEVRQAGGMQGPWGVGGPGAHPVGDVGHVPHQQHGGRQCRRRGQKVPGRLRAGTGTECRPALRWRQAQRLGHQAGGLHGAQVRARQDLGRPHGLAREVGGGGGHGQSPWGRQRPARIAGAAGGRRRPVAHDVQGVHGSSHQS